MAVVDSRPSKVYRVTSYGFDDSSGLPMGTLTLDYIGEQWLQPGKEHIALDHYLREEAGVFGGGTWYVVHPDRDPELIITYQ